MSLQSVVLAVKKYGPFVIGILGAIGEVYVEGMTLRAFITAAGIALFAYLVKPKAMTGGTIPNPVSADGTVPDHLVK